MYSYIVFNTFYIYYIITYNNVVEEVIVKTVPLPTQVEAFMDKEKAAISICTYDELKHYLLKQETAQWAAS